MRGRTRQLLHRLTTISTGLLAVALLTGCELLEELAGPSPASSPVRTVGQNGNRMLYIYGEPYNPYINPDALRDVRVLDLETLETELVLEDIPVGLAMVANGRWIASVADNVVRVLNRDSGAELLYSPGLEGSWDYVGIAGLLDDRLVVAISRCSPFDLPSCDRFEYVLVDLNSGQSTLITDHAYRGALAMTDEYFAFTNSLPTDVEPLSNESKYNLELIDLATGESKVVASDRRVPGPFDLFFHNGQLLWQEYKPGGFESRIRSYDLQTGKTTTLVDNFEFNENDRFLLDVSDGRMLVETFEYRGFFGAGTTSLELWTFDGNVTQVGRFISTPEQPHKYRITSSFMGDFVVWTDPMTGGLGIYGLESGTTRHFDPAGERVAFS